MPALRSFVLASLLLAACTSSNSSQPPKLQLGSGFQQITYGTPDDVPAHMAVVALGNADQGFFCSGTLVAPRVVMTAGHCVTLVSQVGLKAGFGGDVNSPDMQWIPAAESRPEPDYNKTQMPNDLGLVRLAAPPPAGIVPIPWLPASLGLTPDDVGLDVDFSGFGDTESGTYGTKLHVTAPLGLICETAGGCSYLEGDVPPDHTICYDQQPGGPCSGDSGGPAFVVKNSIEYVAGATSYGDQACEVEGCSTAVWDFEPFILSFIGDIGPKNDGAACSAGSECQTGFCVDGVCCNVACGKDGCTACSAAHGATADGQCSPISGSCDDHDACTENDTCVQGVCTGTPRACPAPDACHEIGTCNPTTGTCGTGPAVDDGTACDDGDDCTTDDACLAGACTGTPRTTCPSNDPCKADAACADKQCGDFTALPEGSSCDDGNPCTIGDTCLGGVCTGNLVSCPLEPCHGWGRCDPATGTCLPGVTLADGAPCDDGQDCTEDDACLAGACVGTPVAGACAAKGCYASGNCQADGTCDGAMLDDGTPCDLGKCTVGGTCQGGQCTGASGDPCVPPDACHVFDSCDPDLGCIWKAAGDGTACDDGNLCTTGDACSGLVCRGAPITCPAPAECRAAGLCLPATGQCLYNWQPDGTACSGGTCQSGACKGSSGCTTAGGPLCLSLALFGLGALLRRRARR